jgi:diketogulonate reductase-like aldo/keto reductase
MVARSNVFLQTKFTYRKAQDDRLPFDPDAAIPVQVQQSFASSLEHLGTDAVEALFLHQPVLKKGIASADLRAWQAMEAIYDRGQARLLGICNVTIEQLQMLNANVRVRPHLVQNRCLARHGWDHDIRQCCAANGQVYQAFSLIAGNPEALTSADMARIGDRHGRDASQIVLRFALDVGMIPLTGTTDVAHMEAALDIFGFRLTADEIKTVERLVN